MAGRLTFEHREPVTHTLTKIVLIGAILAAAGYAVHEGLEFWDQAIAAREELDDFLSNTQNKTDFTIEDYEAREAELTEPVRTATTAAALRFAAVPAALWTWWVIRPYKKTSAWQFNDGSISFFN